MTAGSPDTPPPPPVRRVTSAEEARREAGATLDALGATMARAAALDESVLRQRVDDEWSTVESIRHLVLVIDVWLSRTILGEEDPFHPIGLPPSFMPAQPPGTSIDPDADPTFAEACDVLRDRLGRVGAYVASLTDADLARPVEAHAETVGGALGVLFDECAAHSYFINRDLDALTA